MICDIHNVEVSCRGVDEKGDMILCCDCGCKWRLFWSPKHGAEILEKLDEGGKA